MLGGKKGEENGREESSLPNLSSLEPLLPPEKGQESPLSPLPLNYAMTSPPRLHVLAIAALLVRDYDPRTAARERHLLDVAWLEVEVVQPVQDGSPNGLYRLGSHSYREY